MLSEPDKLWPNIPPPHAQSAPIPVPMCNGCGASGAPSDGLMLLGSSLGKTSQKYGQSAVQRCPVADICLIFISVLRNSRPYILFDLLDDAEDTRSNLR